MRCESYPRAPWTALSIAQEIALPRRAGALAIIHDRESFSAVPQISRTAERGPARFLRAGGPLSE